MNYYSIPENDEYSFFLKTYIQRVRENNVIEALKVGHIQTLDFFNHLPKEKWEYKYQENKWTSKEILGHIIDAERVFVYRALAFSRNDSTALPGYDENKYVENADFNSILTCNLLEEYDLLRKSTINFFEILQPEKLLNTGIANSSMVSVRSLGFAIAGHEIHHVQVIREKYL